MILHLNGEKTWYISNKKEPFFSIKYKSLLNPNPLYVTDKQPHQEIAFTLEPGDLLIMGKPSGVGHARTPPLWMKDGDHVEIEIEGIGVLANSVIAG